MLSIAGIIFVNLCVFLGYILHGGNMLILWQPTEVLIICGAAVGGLMISAPMAVIKRMIGMSISSLTGSGPGKKEYLDLLLLLFEIFKTAKGNLLGLETHVETPENSEIFKRYPSVLKNHHAIHFLCDTLKVQISSPVSPFDLEELMDKDIESAHQEEHEAPAAVSRVSDALPGLGIVAAVLGVVITMGKLSEGKEAIGHSVASALVGTFLGIFLAYGFTSPLAAKMSNDIAEQGKFMEAIKAGLLAFSKDASPKVCVEFARRTIPPEIRPTFTEIDEATSNIKK